MKGLWILMIGFLCWSCEKEKNCSITDYLGSWNGTYKCDTFQAENINLKLIQTEVENQVKIEGPDLNNEILVFSDCKISMARNSLELSYKITGDLNGSKNILSLRKESTSSQGIIFCELTLIR